MAKRAKKLGLVSGIGLVMADMVGTGVLTTAGFMALELSPGHILLDWLAGGLVALCGALAYAALARMVPRSGGEYRYLSSLVHPSVGYIAGWASLLVGFSVPVALAALAAGAFSETVFPAIDGRIIGALIIGLISATHAVGLKSSKWTQDGLALAKGALLLCFIAIGLSEGRNVLPEWTPPPEDAGFGFPFAAFFTSLIFITFCYTGWNAATYASEEFENPRRDVPRAMIAGCLLVTGTYLLVNWIFVTNLSQGDMTGWIQGDTDRITLAHLVVRNLIGNGAATAMSAVVIIALTSAISAMTLIGPRVYAAMARDRFLPSVFGATAGRPPVGSIALQGGLAVGLVFFSGFREMLNNVGSILAIISAMTVLSLLRSSRWRRGERPALSGLIGAVVYAGMSAWMVYYAIAASTTVEALGIAMPSVLLWMLGVIAVAILGYAFTHFLRPEAGRPANRRGEDAPAEDWTDRRTQAHSGGIVSLRPRRAEGDV